MMPYYSEWLGPKKQLDEEYEEPNIKPVDALDAAFLVFFESIDADARLWDYEKKERVPEDAHEECWASHANYKKALQAAIDAHAKYEESQASSRHIARERSQ